MMGCLTAPFKVLGCVGLLVLLGLGYLYRDRVMSEGRRLLQGIEAPSESPSSSSPASSASSRGRPGSRPLAVAKAKVDSLNGWRADSVVLSPAEVASLMGQGLAPGLRQELDSLEVELLDGQVKLRARLRTARLPKEVSGPLAFALREREPVEATGPLRVIGPGTGEWAVHSFRIRSFPIPGPAVKQLISRALRDPTRETVPWQVPPGVRAVRVHPGGAILYGASRP